jgi:hypothetical protein
MNKFRASKAREEKLKTDFQTQEEKFKTALAAEQQKQRTFLTELQQFVSDATGQVVKIGGVIPSIMAPSMNSVYDRKTIVARIVELREVEKLSFDAIALKLNGEGFKPRLASAFTSATVYRMYENSTGKTATSAAA